MRFADHKGDVPARAKGREQVSERGLGCGAMLDDMRAKECIETLSADLVQRSAFHADARSTGQGGTGLGQHGLRRVDQGKRVKNAVAPEKSRSQGAGAAPDIGYTPAPWWRRKSGEKLVIGSRIAEARHFSTPAGRGAIIAVGECFSHGAFIARTARPRFRRSAKDARQTDKPRPLASLAGRR